MYNFVSLINITNVHMICITVAICIMGGWLCVCRIILRSLAYFWPQVVGMCCLLDIVQKCIITVHMWHII